MLNIQAVRSAVSKFVGIQSLVAVFVGGTSGIGEYTIRALASIAAEHSKGLRLYLVGRSASKAKEIIADCKRIYPSGQFLFVQAGDLALLKEVDRVCAELTHMERENAGSETARIDLLVQSQAFPILEERRDTTEGLDALMSLLYYSRLRFTTQLLPLLLASTLPSAHIISIFAAGTESTFIPSDLALRDLTNYKYFTMRSHVTHMKTFAFETLAAEHPGRLSFVHIFPGLVFTPAFQGKGNPLWFRLLWWFISPLMRFYAVPSEECGMRMLYLATERFPARAEGGGGAGKVEATEDVALGTDGEKGSGVYSVGEKGEVIDVRKRYDGLRKEEMGKKVWEHTQTVFGEIEREGRFES